MFVRLHACWQLIDTSILIFDKVLVNLFRKMGLENLRTSTDNTRLLHKGKYYCATDQLLVKFGFRRFVTIPRIINKFTCLIESKQEVSHAVILPLMKCVYSLTLKMFR